MRWNRDVLQDKIYLKVPCWRRETARQREIRGALASNTAWEAKLRAKLPTLSCEFRANKDNAPALCTCEEKMLFAPSAFDLWADEHGERPHMGGVPASGRIC